MGKSVLKDAKSFRFKDLDLSGNLVSWNDKIGIRLAVHEFLKVDGALVERMGNAPGRFSMQVVFLGDDWASRYRAVVASIKDDSKGQMVHPLLGEMPVACEGISDARVVPGQERDTITFTLTFVEDLLSRVSTKDQDVPAKSQAITTATANLTAQSAGFTSAATKVTTLVTQASVYASTATSAALGSVPNY